jgi:hypothetical protein
VPLSLPNTSSSALPDCILANILPIISVVLGNDADVVTSA